LHAINAQKALNRHMKPTAALAATAHGQRVRSLLPMLARQ
jgi:hypothetical protein